MPAAISAPVTTPHTDCVPARPPPNAVAIRGTSGLSTPMYSHITMSVVSAQLSLRASNSAMYLSSIASKSFFIGIPPHARRAYPHAAAFD